MNAVNRKRLLTMARRRAKPGSGSVLRAVREKRSAYGRALALPDLKPLRHVIVGGLATALYMPERMTLDTDVLIARKDLEEAEALLKKGGHRRIGTLSIGGSSWRLRGGRNLDLIALGQPWVEEALSSAVLDDAQQPFVSLPFLVLMKLESGRLQDLADISRMMGCAATAQVKATRALIARYRPQDLADLESMVRLGKLEHK